MPAHGAEDVRQAWGRVTGRLEQHAPAVFARLGGPGSPAAVSAAEERMGLRLNGYLVNDKGRIPAAIRVAYDASR